MEAVSAPTAVPMNTSTLLAIEEQSQVGAARRFATSLGRDAGLGGDAGGRLAIAVTEAATNILRHAGRGVLVLRAFENDARATVELLAIDKGPGIPSVDRALNDGYSTVGTAGNGLGGIRRLSHMFEMHSQVGAGTVLMARIAEGSPQIASTASHRVTLEDRLGAICVPFRGETECGDAWRVSSSRRHIAIMVSDGLGHGPGAALASAAATAVFPTTGRQPPKAALAAFDRSLRGTRGAALSFAVVDEASRAVHFCGVGNVDARIVSEESPAHLVPQNGIVGHTMPALRSTTAAWPADARLVMHSDGVSARWRLDAYPGLAQAHPSLIAGVIYRDFGRERDDVTVLVLAPEPPQ